MVDEIACSQGDHSWVVSLMNEPDIWELADGVGRSETVMWAANVDCPYCKLFFAVQFNQLVRVEWVKRHLQSASSGASP